MAASSRPPNSNSARRWAPRSIALFRYIAWMNATTLPLSAGLRPAHRGLFLAIALGVFALCTGPASMVTPIGQIRACS
jgi:hypothetical protein